MQRRAGTTLAQIIRGDIEAGDYDIAQLALFLSMEVRRDSKSALVKNLHSYFRWTHLLEKLYLDNMETINDSQRKLRT